MDLLKPTLYLIRGVSGAGKSTFANSLYRSQLVAGVIEADDYFTNADGDYLFNPQNLGRAHHKCKTRTMAFLLSNQSVAVSNTSVDRLDVETYQLIAKDCGANFVSIIVENRNDTKSIHSVPEKTLERQRARFNIKL